MSSVEHLFVCLVAICTFSLKKWMLSVSALSDWVVCFSSIDPHEQLVYFRVNPLPAVSFVSILSLSEGCLFTLLIVSFIVQKFLSVIRSHLFTLLLFPLF